MKRINLLDENTSNKIAAGEVVERPFSVVKEIVENSIDSNATSIIIEINEGGQKLIKVTDNGDGIHPEDIRLAFTPHATSKIHEVDDLFHLSTMGFRGEALASIAAISNTKLISRTSDYDYGKEIYIEGGIINYLKDCGANKGTTIEVSDLFFNVPARQKFLKSSSREAALISEITGKLALSNPHIAFKLFSNGKNVITTYGTGKVEDVIRELNNKSIYENIVAFEKHSDTISLSGFIGNSEISKGSRSAQSIFVNKRYIKNKLITAAVETAFKSFLTVNKFPFFILFVEIYPELLDVNVHPTKSEVKFQNERDLFKIIFDCVHEAVRKNLNYSFSEEFDPKIPNTFSIEEPSTVQIPIDLKGKSYYTDKQVLNTYEPKMQSSNYNVLEHSINTYNYEVPSVKYESVNDKQISDINTDKIPELKIIGQFNNTYILAEAKEELYLIDQHAAHEKVLFEEFEMEIKDKEVLSQILMSPVVIELPLEDFLTYTENTSIFKSAGFNIEPFGENTISIREVPMLLGKPDLFKLFGEILENLKNLGSGKTNEVKYDTIARLSCKAAIKANNSLNDSEIKALVKKLSWLEDPYNCPHGRPTIIKFSLYELEKRFKRVQ